MYLAVQLLTSKTMVGVVQIVWGVSLFQMAWAAIMDKGEVLWHITSVISGIGCLEMTVEHVWMMETGMERCQSVVSDERSTVLTCIYNLFAFTIGLNGGNIALLVLSILFWLLSIFLTVIGCVALKKEISCKQRSLLNFQITPSWSKITCVVLLAIEILFLVVVLPLWISAGAIPDSQNS